MSWSCGSVAATRCTVEGGRAARRDSAHCRHRRGLARRASGGCRDNNPPSRRAHARPRAARDCRRASPNLTPIRANQIRDVLRRNWPAKKATTPGATSYHATTAVYTFGVWARTRTATGSALRNAPGYVQAHPRLTPPMTRKARMSRSRLAPAWGRRRSLPAGIHSDGSDPTNGGDGVVHQVVHLVPHPPRSRAAPAAKRGGRSRPLPLRWRGSAATG